jgi:hypothetical protein
MRTGLHRTSAAIVAGALAVTGCAYNRAEGTAATGEPLQAGWAGFRQGSTPIDEQDFYRIAGDGSGADEIAAYRSRGITYNRVGLVLALIGGAALVTLGASDDATVRGAAGAFVIALPIGGFLTYSGQARAHKERVLPDWRATEDADRYNAHAGAAP